MAHAFDGYVNSSASLARTLAEILHAQLLYDEASASAKADYANFFEESRGERRGTLTRNAAAERKTFQDGTSEALAVLLREEAVQLNASFEKTCASSLLALLRFLPD